MMMIIKKLKNNQKVQKILMTMIKKKKNNKLKNNQKVKN